MQGVGNAYFWDSLLLQRDTSCRILRQVILSFLEMLYFIRMCLLIGIEVGRRHQKAFTELTHGSIPTTRMDIILDIEEVI